ncbi:primosomal protein N' (replication factor Y) [Desulfohalotomaculum tongense]|uniref:primosomal protein N' n=1 Tax=Desulforadius tongensis TaxID=1216062 RepID=UPI00195CCA1A|nr:primosomal protein N' [Desulforadius tongensis]MBM7855738.1 primosomal protein N' (replication factor Y) [Desulforadius tongensis]
MGNNKYAEVFVEIPSRQLDRPFHYIVPQHLQPLPVGSRVLVPFGSRTVPGYVVDYSLPPEGVKVKPVQKVLGEGLTPELLELARWLSTRYFCTFAESLHCVLGPGREKKRVPRGLYAAVEKQQLAALSVTPKQRGVLETALARPGLNRTQLARAAGVSASTVGTLLKKKLLKWAAGDTAVNNEETRAEKPPPLTLEQQEVVGHLKRAISRGGYGAFLLHGVTGSGKTEVYLAAIAEVLKRGKQAIVLVPEISLTPQMVSVFCRRFGSKVAVLHSRLSAGERYGEHRRIQRGEALVVLGARSAVFAPVPKLGIVIIDEEHEPMYKQEENPKYHAREVAVQRARITGAVVLLASATPALESYCRAEPGGPYRLLTMTKRVKNLPLPRVEVVDMRREMDAGNRGIFSRLLLEKITERLEQRQQVVLFINRRGFATFIVCRKCGLVLKCPHCDISLTYHYDGFMRCHYCNYNQRAPEICPRCSDDAIGYFGAGTQKVEQEIRRCFPQARVLRMDGDTTGRKGAHQEIIAAFKEGRGDILVGTQMIAKGLDMPNVTLVGVVNADTMLYMPEFRAAERTFQLLTQVAGRAGRGRYPGETVIQTHSPEHYSIIYARNHDFLSFYNQEMQLRRALKYPPFYYLSRVLVSGENHQRVEKAAREIRHLLDQLAGAVEQEEKKVIVMGPAPSTLSKIQKRYRWQVLIKGRMAGSVRQVTAEAVQLWGRKSGGRSEVSVSVDIDPQFLI